MASKYDRYWKSILPKITNLLHEMSEKGYSSTIDVSEIKKYGNRKSWSTQVSIPIGTSKINENHSSDAHGKSLGNIIIQSSLLTNQETPIFAYISTEKDSLYLKFKKSTTKHSSEKQVTTQHLTPKIYTKKVKHNERCPECKKTIELMLEKIYGKVSANHKFDTNTKPEGFKKTPLYREIKEIYTSLQNYRGHQEFVRSNNLRPCDFFVPDPGFILEFDESQHFTSSRKLTLTKYPKTIKLGYNREKWIELCERINAKDNDPPFRDEQRAWYDTLRDIIPAVMNLNPTIRLYSKDFKWCSLDPNLSSDIEKFKKILLRLNQNLVIDVNEDPEASIARIMTSGDKDWKGDIASARQILKDTIDAWPSKKRVKFLITGGGFVQFPWPNHITAIKDSLNPNPKIVDALIEKADKQCDSLLEGLWKKLENCTDYITIGIDSQKKKISSTQNYISEPHIELVCLVDLNTKEKHWTGKSYPTNKQEKGLIRITDLSSHFIDTTHGKIMILGCHDLTLFNNRNMTNTRGWRKDLKKEFRKLTKIEKPKFVLHHPHTISCMSVWTAPWAFLKTENPSIQAYASAGIWPYNGDHSYKNEKKHSSPHCTLTKTLEKTSYGNTLDFVVHLK